MNISDHDRTILKKLAEKQAAIAARPVHKKKMKEWARLNGLKRGRPLVYIYQVAWWEFNERDGLKLECRDESCRQLEQSFRYLIYQWEHFPADMVVEPVFYCHPVVHDTGFGIQEQSESMSSNEQGYTSRHFIPQITCAADVEKIKMPQITYDAEATDQNFRFFNDLFGDILTIKNRGVDIRWFAPWDRLITWYGVQEALLDMALRPELIHASIDRLVTAYLCRLEQYEKLNLLSLTGTSGNMLIGSELGYTGMLVGSGGLGYTDELPQKDFNPARVRTIDQWGHAAAQIFCEVSPAMHEEFALQYERRWLERFGLAYYGCCEPLHLKVDMLKSVKNLRKISMNYRVDVDKAVANVGDQYVFSYKPNPAWLATDKWNPEGVRKEMKAILEKTRGCVLEIVLKDISTVRSDPQRLQEWERIVMELAEK